VQGGHGEQEPAAAGVAGKKTPAGPAVAPPVAEEAAAWRRRGPKALPGMTVTPVM